MTESPTLDTLFQEAVSTIDSGNIAALDSLLSAHPQLVRERLNTPREWLRSQVGNALDSFFQYPYLLWFVAEDPVRNGKLPSNIPQVTHAILEALKREQVESQQEQLDYALQLVCFSWIARECDVQIGLIDVLVDAGASMQGCADNALVNGNFDAAAHLVKRGAPLTFTVALCLKDWERADSLAASVSSSEKQRGLVQAALHGNAQAVARALALGAEVNLPCPDLYSHASPLHHAVSAGSLETVKVLIEAGADTSTKDTAYQGTPLGWAHHCLADQKNDEGRERYGAIVRYLGQQTKT
ncbi:MAG: ankyrin repeat domain-containing protein [Armatimonas sp.]